MRLARLLLAALGVSALWTGEAAGQGVGFRRAEYTVGAGPAAVAVGDFDGDGKLDLAVANSNDNTVSILLGNGDGTFRAKTDFATGAGPVGIATADLDGDGKLDLATVNINDSKVSILLGNGNGTFGLHTDFTTGTFPAGIAVGDFDGDGKPDLVTANAGGGDISILMGLGGGVFGPNVNYTIGTGVDRVVVGDFDGDSRQDVAAARRDNAVSILLGHGDGTFGPHTDFVTGSRSMSLAKGDFNVDTRLDLVSANLDVSTVSVLLGKGDGTFDPRTDLGTDTEPIAVTAADFNADGKADFLTANVGFYYCTNFYYGSCLSGFNLPTASLRLGNGDGTFGGLFNFRLASVPAGMALGDFNTDGRIDVAIANAGDNTVSILLQSAAVRPSPDSLSFGARVIGSTSSPQTVTLDSTGSFSATVSSVTLAGTDPGEFSISADTCSGNTVAFGSNCTVSAAFAPTATGIKSASLVIAHNAPDSPATVFLTGTGIGSAPTPEFAPSSLSFGSVRVGQMSSLSITLTNSGTATLNITSVTLTGPDAAEFLLNDHCAGTSLGTNSTCQIDVTFRPTSAGAKSAAVSVATNAASSPDSVPLSGTGTPLPPAVSLAPTSLTFNPQLVNTPSAAQTVMLTNTGGSALTITGITLTGANASEFSLTNNCAASLAAGANCTFSIVFTPTSAGSKSASVSIVTNAASSPDSVTLSGTGITPAAVSLAPTSLTFDPQLVNTPSAPKTVILTNTGGSTLTITGITLTGANATDFARSDNCGSSVNGGASCTITLTFKPTATGSRAATLSVSSNASGSPPTAALSGEGSDFSIGAASGSSTTATVSPGGAASFTLSFGAVNGFSGTLGLSCSTSSPEVSCAVPASVVVPNNVTVNVTTTMRAFAPVLGQPPEQAGLAFERTLLAWMAALLLLGAMLRSRMARSREMGVCLRAAAAFGGFFLCALLWSGCAGGNAQPPAPRNYSVTVSGSTSGVVHTTNLTVVVR